MTATQPSLVPWLQQLAGILPLLALIEFIDMASKLHVFDLSGAIPFWNWPVTPSGARLLLSDRAHSSSCLLDQVGHRPILHCIDCRFRDYYPSSAPATVRMCQDDNPIVSLFNKSENMRNPLARIHTLDIICLSCRKPTVLENEVSSSPLPYMYRIRHILLQLLRKHSLRFWLVSVTGWVLWTGIVAYSVLSGLYLAASYMLLMPWVGLLMHILRGGAPRQLLDSRKSCSRRLVVAADSLNGTEWWAFSGGSNIVNSLLNKPLYRRGDGLTDAFAAGPRGQLLHITLRLAILGQWVLAVGASAVQDWNAFLISFWIIFCAVASTYGYPHNASAHDWLRLNCNVVFRTLRVQFGTRRAMLAALVCLNPDTKEGGVSWMDPILAPCQERTDWETALLDYIENGKKREESIYWWKFIVEGVDVAKRVEQIIAQDKIFEGV